MLMISPMVLQQSPQHWHTKVMTRYPVSAVRFSERINIVFFLQYPQKCLYPDHSAGYSISRYDYSGGM
jgi:hypothetical protein